MENISSKEESDENKTSELKNTFSKNVLLINTIEGEKIGRFVIFEAYTTRSDD